ncbi:MAG: hypothetical protein V8R27_06440 [Oscillospiraceae bacterium]
MTGFAVDGRNPLTHGAERAEAAALCQKEPEGTLPYVQTEDLAAHWQSSGPTGSAIPLRK